MHRNPEGHGGGFHGRATDGDQARTLDVVLTGLLGLAEFTVDAAWAVVSAALRDAERWHRPPREEEVLRSISGRPIPTRDWMGDAAARTAGSVLVVLSARGCEPACARLRAAFAATPAVSATHGMREMPEMSAGVRLDWCLVCGAAAALAERRDLDPESRRSLVVALLTSPIAPDLRATRDCLLRGMPDDTGAALTLAERMLARAGSPSDEAEVMSARSDLVHGAFELLGPLWTRCGPEVAADFRRRLVACCDRLLDDPVYDLEVWKRWLAGSHDQ